RGAPPRHQAEQPDALRRAGRGGQAARLRHRPPSRSLAPDHPHRDHHRQARGDRDADARADLFSLGAVLYECLTGRPAFTGAHVIALLAKVLLEDAPRVTALRPEVPEVLADLVERLMQKNPEDRPPDAGAVLAAL